jgi:hypothetical protein
MIVRGRPSVACLDWTCALTLVGAGCSRKADSPADAVRPAQALRPAPQFGPVKGAGEALQAATLVTEPLPQLRSHLAILTILLRGGEPVSLPIEHEGVLEVRAGSVTTSVDGHREVRERGAMWRVAQGSRVVLQAPGELAVLQAIYLVPGEK